MMTLLSQFSTQALWSTISELDEDHSYAEYHAAVEEEQNKSIARLKVEILRTRLAREFERSKHEKLCESKGKKIESIRVRLEQHHQEYKSEVSVHRYVPHVKTIAAPSYIYLLQAKVLRDLHEFCIQDHQEMLMEQHSTSLIRATKRSMNAQAEERLCVERDILTAMMAVQQDTEDLKGMYKERLSVQRGLLMALRQRYSDNFERSPGIEDLLHKMTRLPTRNCSEDSDDKLTTDSGGSNGTMDTSITTEGTLSPTENVIVFVESQLPWSGSDLPSQKSIMCL
uniref:Uncharacterized protein n=1 Tax=Grammatophora oceanica TaxID=210454 RepID=A0A7S1V4Q9_9STRA|mmetsp:Transcript_36649/g.54616  ORF Transcript_36649/g.54616 Transcript_36649/m.54616 type:complete len:283 (+) Transcript_36649:118-966(+)|eukprot:CAMPEP_0194031368 /NCGR_PEP_ID=MMETSP0009_2-20130614/4557_1 /TAXON_ID=210454 /ORGANISM="Grammatophora oceanica, Strain CCMP 410" /LENGTH=282 /DNA_ID=CAMNT_0038671507 /DNA_START=118 /DNA_END=966 /DNA_ORIENTATION=+